VLVRANDVIQQKVWQIGTGGHGNKVRQELGAPTLEDLFEQLYHKSGLFGKLDLVGGVGRHAVLTTAT
jgi:hypothetical protein